MAKLKREERSGRVKRVQTLCNIDQHSLWEQGFNPEKTSCLFYINPLSPPFWSKSREPSLVDKSSSTLTLRPDNPFYWPSERKAAQQIANWLIVLIGFYLVWKTCLKIFPLFLILLLLSSLKNGTWKFTERDTMTRDIPSFLHLGWWRERERLMQRGEETHYITRWNNLPDPRYNVNIRFDSISLDKRWFVI